MKKLQKRGTLAQLGEERVKYIKNQYQLTESELAFLIEMNKRYRKKLPQSISDIFYKP